MKTTIFYFHVVYLEQLHFPQMQSVLAQFAEIMEGSQKAMKISNKTEWWKMRKGLDADLQVTQSHFDINVAIKSLCNK